MLLFAPKGMACFASNLSPSFRRSPLESQFPDRGIRFSPCERFIFPNLALRLESVLNRVAVAATCPR